MDKQEFDNLIKDADGKIGIVELCKGSRPDGTACFSYVSIIPSKYELFIEAQSKGLAIDLAEYGEILYMADGEEPDAKTRQMMEEKFGVEHDFEEQMIRLLEGLDE